jgi:hypothetical protein
MQLSFADLPTDVRDAFLTSVVTQEEAGGLQRLGATATISMVVVVDNTNGVTYTTRDGGKFFEVEKINAPSGSWQPSPFTPSSSGANPDNPR